MGRLAVYGQVSCAVNPACGREAEYGLTPALQRKHVMVVGGGLAGMEAARVAALRGHVVALYEKSDRLGGVVIPGGVPDFKEDEHALVRWYERELRELKVPLTFNTEATEDLITRAAPDVLIVATGAKPKMLPLANEAHVYTAEEVLNGDKPADDHTIIIGAGLVGCELALWLSDQGKSTTIVEIEPKILAQAGPLCHANATMLKELMEFRAVKVMTSSTVERHAEGGYVVKTGDKETFVEAESAILAIGYEPERRLYDKVRNKAPEVYVFGDARRVQNIMYAIWDAYEVARAI
jgi:2-enoate reductase